ncbi:MAG: ABC transporter permease [Candidatus Bilamarchaeaceae archaeon]
MNFTAIYFMWRREVIRFFRSKSRILGSLGMPFFMLAILGTGLNGAINLDGSGAGNYLDFMAPGILAMVLLFASVFSGVLVIMDRQFGFLKETLVAPVSRTDIVLGKSIGGGTTAVLQGVIMLAVAMLLGAHINVLHFVPALAIMFVISVSFVSLGVMIASTMEDMHGFQLVTNFLVMPMFFLSGALFPLKSAPDFVRWISYIDPLTYSVESLRYVLSGSSFLPLYVSLGANLIFLAITTVAAAYLFSRIES